MSQLTLPIVVGKKYVRRDGEIVVAQRNHPDIADDTVFIDNTEVTNSGDLHAYIDTGRVYRQEENINDLVADYVKPAEQTQPAPTTPHPHAALMLEYARDWAETPWPWDRWEYLEGGTGEWLDIIGDHPSWDRDNVYRRKPRTVNINGHKVPEPLRKPLREPLKYGTVYWMPALGHPEKAESCVWLGEAADMQFLARGVVHLVREAAVAHAEALLSFTTSV